MHENSIVIEYKAVVNQALQQLDDLGVTMDVIYEGLHTGAMKEESPQCILSLRQLVDNISRTLEVTENIEEAFLHEKL